MLKKAPLETFQEAEGTLNASKKALQYLYDEAQEEGKTEVMQAHDGAMITCDEMLMACQTCPIKESNALLGFYFIRAVLVLNPDEIRPLLSFLEWMSVTKKYH